MGGQLDVEDFAAAFAATPGGAEVRETSIKDLVQGSGTKPRGKESAATFDTMCDIIQIYKGETQDQEQASTVQNLCKTCANPKALASC